MKYRGKPKSEEDRLKQNGYNSLSLQDDRMLQPRVTAKSWIIMDGESGEILQGSNYNTKREIASLTKIMTCYLALELCRKMDVTMSNTYAEVSQYSSSIGGTSAQLCKGDILSVEDLFYGLMLPSGNDAALTFAENFGVYAMYKQKLRSKNPISYFVSEMNQKSKELRLSNTLFHNPHGLSRPNNYSTAYDMAILSSIMIKDDFFRKLVNTRNHYCTIQDEEGYTKEAFWENTNRLLGLGYNGIKTGYTVDAGFCLASYYKCNSRDLIIIVLGCKTMEDRWQETVTLTQWCIQQFS